MQLCHASAHAQALHASSFTLCKRYRVALSVHDRCWVATTHTVQHKYPSTSAQRCKGRDSSMSSCCAALLALWQSLRQTSHLEAMQSSLQPHLH